MNIVPQPPNGAACEKVRGNLDAYLSRELPVETRREVERHLETCPECAAELETLGRVRAQLKAAVREMQAPSGLDVKIRSALRERQARPRTGLWAVAAAAAVIGCVGLVSYLRQHADPQQTILNKTTGRLAAILNAGLRDHLQCAFFRKYPKQPIPTQEMVAGLGPGFADLLPLVQAKLPGDLRVIQAHLCEAGGRQYTHFIISGPGADDDNTKVVSLILTRKQPGEWLDEGIHQTGVDRFQVVAFESHDYFAYVISGLNAQEDLKLAASLAPTVRQYLAAHG